MRNGNTSATSWTLLALLLLFSGVIVAGGNGLITGLFGSSAVIIGFLLFGALFAAAGLGTFNMSFDVVEDYGGFLISSALLILGLTLVFQGFGMNWMSFIPAWLVTGFAALGLLLVNWHWVNDNLLKGF